MDMNNAALQKLLQEIEAKAVFAQQQMAVVKGQMDSSRRELRLNTLVAEEMAALPSGANMYEGCGKMFVAAPSAEIDARLGRERDELGRKLADLDKKYTFLETTFRNSQEHLDRVFKNGGR